MTGRKIFVFALVAAILPAMAITMPTSQAQAKDGRNAAFIAGLVAGAVGAAVIYNHSNTRWNRVQNHYHRGTYNVCHTHNGVRHCHRKTKYRPPAVQYNGRPQAVRTYGQPAKVRTYGRPAPWTRSWIRYCSNKYRSFNPRTGYYTTYSGYKRFCK